MHLLLLPLICLSTPGCLGGYDRVLYMHQILFWRTDTLQSPSSHNSAQRDKIELFRDRTVARSAFVRLAETSGALPALVRKFARREMYG